MEQPPHHILGHPAEVLLAILEQLRHDKRTLCNLGLVCKIFRDLTLPVLLSTVDLSFHNSGRVLTAKYSPLTLLPRQHLFLRLISSRPDLASYVKSFTWTLLWIGDKGSEDSHINANELWDVFSHLTNVRQLDLASLHCGSQNYYVHNPPPRLFPAVTHLRLVGWMHRGLVNAIVTSLNPTALRALDLHYLQDEGSFPDGNPISKKLAWAHARDARRGDFSGIMISRVSISEELYQRQRTGSAWIFPGPMWTPLHHLSTSRCTTLTTLELRIIPLVSVLDTPNYFRYFDEVAKLLSTVSTTLQTLIILFADSHTNVGLSYKSAFHMCYSRAQGFSVVNMADDFLRTILPGLVSADFPALTSATIQGFHMLYHPRLVDAQKRAFKGLDQLNRDPLFVPLPKFRIESASLYWGNSCPPDDAALAEHLKVVEQS
ncbi:hypothetical protein FQN51_005414 [Onygenales sp. PD_10]|nr:hypothetical protein FQN51_005414 [Onygenales sp. PD_10]